MVIGSLGGEGGETLVTPASNFCIIVAVMGFCRPVSLCKYPIEDE